MHRNWTVSRAERLFNIIEQRRQGQINARLADREFVAATYPYQEAAARLETLSLARLQDKLMSFMV